MIGGDGGEERGRGRQHFRAVGLRAPLLLVLGKRSSSRPGGGVGGHARNIHTYIHTPYPYIDTHSTYTNAHIYEHMYFVYTYICTYVHTCSARENEQSAVLRPGTDTGGGGGGCLQGRDASEGARAGHASASRLEGKRGDGPRLRARAIQGISRRGQDEAPPRRRRQGIAFCHDPIHSMPDPNSHALAWDGYQHVCMRASPDASKCKKMMR